MCVANGWNVFTEKEQPKEGLATNMNNVGDMVAVWEANGMRRQLHKS